MKILIIILVLVLCIFGAQYAVNKSTNKTESYKYNTLSTNDGIEIRQYEDALFTSVTMNNSSYGQSSSAGFRVLAGYIFGDNAKNEKIAMTSPVIMEMDSLVTMRFMVPSSYSTKDLPEPTSKSIKIDRIEGKKYAVIKFAGWSSDQRIKEFSDILRDKLVKQQLSFIDKVIYLGYNPPYQLTNRKNEIMFELDF
mgnify:CR=1 FL=1